MPEFALDPDRPSQKRAFRYFQEKVPYKTSRTVTIILQYKERSARILDIGSGSGQVLSRIRETFPDIWGLEVSRQHVCEANRRLECGSRPRVMVGSAEEMPFKAGSFDAVVSNTMIEHIERPEKMLAEARRVLRDDGILFLTTANKYWPIEPHYFLPFLSYLPSWIANAYVRLFRVAERYDDIHLPTYRGLMRLLQKDFIPEDKTLDVIENYRRYGFHSKRLFKVSILSKILNLARKNALLYGVARRAILYSSLGWIIVGKKRGAGRR